MYRMHATQDSSTVTDSNDTAEDTRAIRLGSAFLAIVAVVGGGLYVWEQYVNPSYEAEIAEAVRSIINGNFSTASAAIAPVLDAGPEHPAYSNAVTIDTAADFNSGERAKRLEAIRKEKDLYIANTGDAYAQSRRVNILLGFLNSGFEKYVYDEVFTGEPFGRFKVESDRQSSIRNLAEHSFELDPSTSSMFRVGQWYADRIRDIFGEWNATPTQKQQYAQEILLLLESSDELLARDLAMSEASVFNFTVEPRYYFWESYLYGAVARVYPEYITNSFDSMRVLEGIYETRLDENGQRNGIIATRLPYTYANYAWTLYELKGEAGYAEAQVYLKKLADVIAENPAVHAGQYLSLVKKNAALSPEKRADTYSARMMMALGDISPEYKALLAQHGFVY